MSRMQIFGGTAKGRFITEVPRKVRPTPAKLRRSLFDILGDIEGIPFVDLFSGSGIVGIEALSRGAYPVTFVEIDKPVCRIIEKNVTSVKLDKYQYSVNCIDALIWLSWHQPCEEEIIFGSPPFIEAMLPKVLTSFEDFAANYPSGKIVILQYPNRQLPDNFEISPKRIQKAGDNALIFWY